MSVRIVGFSGNTRRPSRSRLLVEAVAAALADRRPVSLALYDLLDAGPGIGATTRESLPHAARDIIADIEEADAIIVGTPIYKGSYAGLFKHLIDFVDPTALMGKPVALTATGGGLRHALAVEHQLRPLFGFFSALTLPTAIYASEAEFQDGRIADAALSARIAQAAGELHRSLGSLPVTLEPRVIP